MKKLRNAAFAATLMSSMLFLTPSMATGQEQDIEVFDLSREIERDLGNGLTAIFATDKHDTGVNFRTDTGFGIEFEGSAGALLDVEIDPEIFDEFIQSNLDDAVTATGITLDVEGNINGRLALDDIDLDIDAESESTQLIVGIPIGQSVNHYFYAGIRQQVDTLFVSVDGRLSCQASGSISANGESASGSVSGCGPGVPTEAGVSGRQRWSYTVAVIGYGYVSDRTNFQILVSTEPFDINFSGSGDFEPLEAEFLGGISGLEIRGSHCTANDHTCFGGHLELMTFAGHLYSADLSAYFITSIGQGTKLEARVDGEGTYFSGGVEASLALHFERGNGNWEFEVGRRRFYWTTLEATSGSLGLLDSPLDNYGLSESGSGSSPFGNYNYNSFGLDDTLNTDDQNFLGLSHDNGRRRIGGRLYEDGYSLFIERPLGRTGRNSFGLSYENIELDSGTGQTADIERFNLGINLQLQGGRIVR